jgi:hypothetical protein
VERRVRTCVVDEDIDVLEVVREGSEEVRH